MKSLIRHWRGRRGILISFAAGSSTRRFFKVRGQPHDDFCLSVLLLVVRQFRHVLSLCRGGSEVRVFDNDVGIPASPLHLAAVVS